MKRDRIVVVKFKRDWRGEHKKGDIVKGFILSEDESLKNQRIWVEGKSDPEMCDLSLYPEHKVFTRNMKGVGAVSEGEDVEISYDAFPLSKAKEVKFSQISTLDEEI